MLFFLIIAISVRGSCYVDKQTKHCNFSSSNLPPVCILTTVYLTLTSNQSMVSRHGGSIQKILRLATRPKWKYDFNEMMKLSRIEN
ncbi:hypothetical protein RIF29_18403 [Crotalaria pallida]|uniref:Uncharacterized protein n=1 Tax=Crotalaria pallida TaxID=3830 RepID=A0AAN9IFF6_CROPI